MSHQAQLAPPIAITVGDPAGIGPDILLKYAQSNTTDDLIVVGDKKALEYRALKLGLSVDSFTVKPVPVQDPTVCGQSTVDNVSGILNMLDCAIDGCLQGDFSAMVTGPINKSIVCDTGLAFSGHTEYLADRCDADQPVMLVGNRQLKVALVTTHLPLQQVSHALTPAHLERVVRVVNHDLIRHFAIASPTILVCGLNPHAGEGGYLGREEIEIIQPTLEKLKRQGIDVRGPVPADTAFTTHAQQGVDVTLAMFHDQGLPVVKASAFGEAANITLGLPIIRTSVDHGTAFELAGTGDVDFGGLATAIEIAREMVRARAQDV